MNGYLQCLKKAAIYCGFSIGSTFVLCSSTQAQDGQWIEENRTPPPLILKDLEGRQYDLTQLKGRIVLINFWASWCAPCMAEMPSLKKLASQWSQNKMVVLAVNFHESPEKIRDLQVKHRLNFPLLRDPWHDVSAAWQVGTLPTTFVIDAKGRLRYRVAGEVNWGDTAVKQRLATCCELGH